MTNSISALRHTRAANENAYEPNWINDVPDDWSHTVLVTSEYPVLNRRHNELQDEAIPSETSNTKAA